MLNLIHFEPKIANYHHFYGFPDKTQHLVGVGIFTPTFTMIPWAIPSPIICLHSSTSVVMDVYKFLLGIQP